ncbi:hypothetical protein OSB04_008162 [Centaurea solstitialis]|uniref:Plastid lipid-associated protein/fibrillin conserved domain-containing protein n=1 Tax=Centaurea solstitialis TaxID=347529 RepID=A0AA38WJ74_9ASTR|nr:hypothetical protein OSB04_008162 [Centaurea solstitialis]
MAAVSLVTQFPTNSITPYPKPTSKSSILSVNSTSFPVKNSAKLKLRFNFTLRAADEVEWESEEETMPLEELLSLKKQLVCMFYCTNFGLGAASETRAEIMELIMQLESMNPTPEPTKALPLLNGKWILAYTSLSLYPLISSAALPFVNVEEISQTIDSENFTVQNCLAFSGLGYNTAFTANARFEVRSPKRVQIKFDEGIIGTPQLTNYIELPEHVEVLGQNLDLTPFKDLITSVRDTTLNVAHIISNQPPLKFSMSETNVESWLLTTYLDGELRISRGDGGSVFVLLKDGSCNNPCLSYNL